MSSLPDSISSGVVGSTNSSSDENDSSSGSDMDEHDVDSDSSQGEDAEMLRAMRDGISDMYGTSDIPQPKALTRQEMKRAREQLRAHLEQPPPQSRPSAYLEALEGSPQLVKTESNPEHFLRACKFNHHQASDCLFSYWRVRCEAFGARAFLPLSQLCGGGALFATDLAILKRGGYAILPADQHNRPVLFVNRSSISEDPKNQARLLFLLFQVLMRNPLAVRNGIVWTMIMDNSSEAQGPKLSPKNRPYPSVLRMISSWPLQVRAFHMVVVGKHRSKLVEHTVPAWSLVLERWQHLSVRSETHVVKVNGDAMRKLENYGLIAQSTPRILGGSLNVESLVNIWFQELVEHKILEQPLNLQELYSVGSKDKSLSKKRKAIDSGLAASKAMKEADGNKRCQDSEKESLLKENALLKEHISRQDAYYKKREEILVGQQLSGYWPSMPSVNAGSEAGVRSGGHQALLNQVRIVADLALHGTQATNQPGNAVLSSPYASVAQSPSVPEAPTASTLASQVYGPESSCSWGGTCPTQPLHQQEYQSLQHRGTLFQPLFRGHQSPLASWQQSVVQPQAQNNDAAINAVLRASIEDSLRSRQRGQDGPRDKS